MTAPSRAIYLHEGGHLAIIEREQARAHGVANSYRGQVYVTRVTAETRTTQTGKSLTQYRPFPDSAVNPADLRHAYMGLHSFVAGYEWAGAVAAAGPDSPYAVGEALFGQDPVGHRRPRTQGAHQDYLLAETAMTFRLPAGMADDDESLRRVVGWPVALQTVADALVNPMGFAFPALASVVAGDDPTGEALLIVSNAAPTGRIPHSSVTKSWPTSFQRDFSWAIFFLTRHITVGRRLDAVAAGTGFAEPAAAASARDGRQSSPALAKRCLSGGAAAPGRARLVASLVVAADPAWQMCLPARPIDDPVTAALTGGRAVPPGWNARIQAVTAWVLRNHAALGFRLPRVTVVDGAEAGMQAIRDVFSGKASMQKFVIKHPM